VKRLQKRGKDLEKLKKLIELLLAGESLPALYKDHPLKLIGLDTGTLTLNRIGC